MVQGHLCIAALKHFSFAREVCPFFYWLYGCFSVTTFWKVHQFSLKGHELKATANEIPYYCNTLGESFQWWPWMRYWGDNGISVFPEQELLFCTNQRLLVATRNSCHLTAVPVNNCQKSLSKFRQREGSNAVPQINIILTVLFLIRT